MRTLDRIGRVLLFLGMIAVSVGAAATFGAGSLWRGFEPALAGAGQPERTNYDLTRLEAVNETLKYVRKKYVDPDRIKPKAMLLSALNYIQREVAQVIVQQQSETEITIQVENESRSFRIDNIQGPWDVAARLREIFAFLQKNLAGAGLDLRDVEYAACNGMLHTLDPHSSFLSPEGYRDMNVTTSGAFGGLGIVISVRDQQLTVMRPMPNTPAQRAGLKRFDRIVKIEGESTLNMPLDDAVKRLRGEKGTSVTLWILREGDGGFTQPKPFQLEREIIKVTSVESRALDGNIGYIKLKGFQSSSTEEFAAALEGFKKAGPIKGLVLDLRGNPGGLLDQAVKIADLFLSDGVIVATVGSSEGREERRAKGPGTESDYPIVVLQSGSSASASEILAGALKNLDRAIVIGQQSFGKGSVQLVFSDITPEKAALKLTIAQYLTPGDISIQGVGVTPDIELDPMTVDSLEMDLTVQKDSVREGELFASLESRYAAPAAKPDDVVRYQFSSASRDRLRELGEDADDEVKVDFPTRFAQELAAAMPAGKPRSEQVRALKQLVDKVKRDELAKVAAELEKVGVDWSAPTEGQKTAAGGDLEVKLETNREQDTVTAGDPIELQITVKNNGHAPVYRLHAQTESESGYFDGKELVFGKIAPGEQKSSRVLFGWCETEGKKYASIHASPKDAKRICKIPMDVSDRSDGVTIVFKAEGGEAPANAELRPTVKALPRPVFKYSYQIVDDRGGNGDGHLQRGEKVSMYLTVKNVGAGRSYETQANLSNLSGDGLELHAGRYDISNMKPGDSRKVTFTFDVARDLRDAEAVLSLAVGDRDLNEIAREKVKIPIKPSAALTAINEVRAAGPSGAVLLESPENAARGFGGLAAGTALTVLGRVGSFDKVKIEGNRFGFVRSSELAPSHAKPGSTLNFSDMFTHAPPELTVGAASLSTRSASMKIHGAASSSTQIKDLYAFVGGRKILYQSNLKGKDPKNVSFDFEVPLRPGVNIVNVFARENADSTSRRTLVIRRDGEGGELLKTPKAQDEADWLAVPDGF